MTIGAFTTSLTKAIALLDEIAMVKMNGTKSIHKDGFSDAFISIMQSGNYFECYKTAKANFDFDVLLRDESFLQFSFDIRNGRPHLRFAFYQNPQEYKTYSEYIAFLVNQGLIDLEEAQQAGDIFVDEYEQFLIEQQVSTKAVSIRYDVDFPSYRPLIHAVSHFHIGHANDLRIPAKTIVTPLQFTLFVLKHAYYYDWERMVTNDGGALLKLLTEAKAHCKVVSQGYWADLEEHDLFLA